jgi:hypothetical protein
VKFEISLSESEHRYLVEASAHDKKFRSIQSFAKDLLMDGLHRVAAQDLGQRKAAVAALVGSGGKRRNT